MNWPRAIVFKVIYLILLFPNFVDFALAGDSFVYVSVLAEKRIAIYRFDEERAELQFLENIETSGEPAGLTVAPNQRILFASIRSKGNLASFARSPDTGSLKLLNEVKADADPAYMTTDRRGRFLLSAYYQAGRVAVHRIGDDGSLDADNVLWIQTDDKAHAIVLNSTNKFAFVPHTGPNAIFQFRFDAEVGQLLPADVPKLEFEANTGPRHLYFHPMAHTIAYVGNEQGSSVTTLRLDEQRQTLETLQTLSTLPADFQGPNSCADIEVSPDGRFVYVSNRGHDSIAAFAVDPKTFKLASIGQFATEQTPRQFTITSSGKHLIAAGQSSGRLRIFQIEQDGGLTALKNVTVGKQPWWVMALPVESDAE